MPPRPRRSSANGATTLRLARAEQRHLADPRPSESRGCALTPPSLAGSAVASARITTGASRPLAPWTVITRTALAGADGSRLISTSPRANQARKRSSDGDFAALELERARQQFVDRVARRQPEPAVELAAAVDRPGQDRFEEARRRREVGHRQQRAERSHAPRRNRSRSPARSRKRAPQRRLLAADRRGRTAGPGSSRSAAKPAGWRG